MKHEEIKQIPTRELIERYKEEQMRLQKLKFSHAVSTMDQPHQMKESRRMVARYLTELNARRIRFEQNAQNKSAE